MGFGEPEEKFEFILIEAKYAGPTDEGIRTSIQMKKLWAAPNKQSTQ